MVRSAPGMAAAAAIQKAAEEKSPGTLKSRAWSLRAAANADGFALLGSEVDDGRRVEMGEQALGVVARGSFFGDAGGAGGEEAGEEEARFQLRAGDGQRVLDAGQRAAFDLQRRGVLFALALDFGAHFAQGIDDAFHGPAGKGGVADQFAGEGLPGQHAGHEAHGGAGVAAVERLERRLKFAARCH